MTRSVFVSVANLDLERASPPARAVGRRPADRGPRRAARRRRPGSDVIIDDLPRDVRTVEVRLVGSRSVRSRRRAGPARRRRPRLGRHPARPHAADPRRRRGRPVPRDRPVVPARRRAVRRDVRPSTGRRPNARTDGRGTSSSSRATSRRRCRGRPILAIAPPRTSPLGEVAGKLTNPGIGSLDPDEPVLRYVDLSTTHISEASQLLDARLGPDDRARAAWRAAAVRGHPRRDRRAAVLAFEPRRSDLPLQVAFPILLANLTGELLGSSTAPTEAVDPGTPVELHIPAGRSGLTVTRPDGATTELVPSRRPAAPRRSRSPAPTCRASTRSRPIVDPQRLGARRRRVPARARPPRRIAEPSAARAPRRASRAARGRLTRWRRCASRSTCSTSTNSTIAPGSAAAIEALGTTAAARPPRVRAGSRAPAPSPSDRRPATSCGSRSCC